jgi:hypothetical protein
MTIDRNREQEEHDRNISGLADATIIAAAKDLDQRRAFDRKNQEHRWIMSRRAALHREILRRKLTH